MLRPKQKKERVKISKSSLKNARKFFAFLRPYRGMFIFGWFFLVASSLTGLAFPLMMGQLLGSSTAENSSVAGMMEALSIRGADTMALALLIVFGAQAIFSFFRIVTFTHVSENVLRDVRQTAFERLVYMPMDFFNQNTVGELTSRISSDIEKIQESMRTTIAEFFRQFIVIVGSLVFLFFLSWKLCLIMLAIMPVMVLIAVFFGRFVRRLSKEAQDHSASANSIIEESLMGITNVKSFTRELFMLGKYSKAVDRIRALNIRSGLWRGVFVSFIIFCLFGAIAFVIWQGALMTQGPNPELAQGDFLSFIIYTVMMGTSFGSLPDFYATIQKAIGATESLMTIIETDTEKELLTGRLTPELSGAVRFNNVHFSYPQRNDVPVLSGLDFEIQPNQTIAFVGSSGAGKTTIASLLLHYYAIQEGSIEFDGINNKDIDIDHLRSFIAIVPQEVILFAGTIRENIAFGRLDATEEEIIEAAKNANAWQFIEQFPERLSTQVGDRGIQLSGGQKQRIAIARAILKDPRILILDEATSALDSESERLVQDALNTLMKGRTSFVIAHRLSTIKNADTILVVENGRIVESGRHDALIATNGSYAKFVELQGMQSI
ncbi:MAG: multidrug ABC transporter ATP-binding protein [Bacteroidetes bacterium RIFCSPHIGHO2_02_FULL_44_7]|nr:MAG: multidrug ABC transporter ATP-binding protein [Bacteroidetes bacterium RIFCSPHIGHO2_02_FULL_44_7]